MSERDEQNAKEVAIIEEAIAAHLRRMDLVGLLATKSLRDRASAAILELLNDFKREGTISPKWDVDVTMKDDVLSVRFLPPPTFVEFKV